MIYSGFSGIKLILFLVRMYIGGYGLLDLALNPTAAKVCITGELPYPSKEPIYCILFYFLFSNRIKYYFFLVFVMTVSVPAPVSEANRASVELERDSEDDSSFIDSFAKVDLVDLIEQPAWKTILLELVRKEKMDPWAIDVAELADKYLHKIHSLEKADLRIPANAILASAILLKMKAKTIRLSSLEELEEDIEEQARKIAEQQLFSDANIPDLLGGRMQRQGLVSIDALVSSIEEILEKTRSKAGARLFGSDVPEFKIPFSEKNIEQKTREIWQRIQERVDSTGIVRFSHLLNEKTSMEMVSVFVPLLFLANREKIVLFQEEFWGEIFVSLNGHSSE